MAFEIANCFTAYTTVKLIIGKESGVMNNIKKWCPLTFLI